MSVRESAHPVDAMFLERWSPRAFTQDVFSEADLLTILEAGRWAPSSFSAQPWRFLYARRGTAHWEKVPRAARTLQPWLGEGRGGADRPGLQFDVAPTGRRRRRSFVYALARCGDRIRLSRAPGQPARPARARHGRLQHRSRLQRSERSTRVSRGGSLRDRSQRRSCSPTGTTSGPRILICRLPLRETRFRGRLPYRADEVSVMILRPILMATATALLGMAGSTLGGAAEPSAAVRDSQPISQGSDALIVAWLESMGTRFLAIRPLTPAALEAPSGGQ
jgi:hypothetical protein